MKADELQELRREVAELREILLAVAMVTGYFHRDAAQRRRWQIEANYVHVEPVRLDGVRHDYINGDIDVTEMERRLERLLHDAHEATTVD